MKEKKCKTCGKMFDKVSGSQLYCSEMCKPWSQRSKWRHEVQERLKEKYGNVCTYCNIDLTHELIHLDHIIPRYEGGTDDESNLALSCSACNMIKGSGTIEYLEYHMEHIRSSAYKSNIRERLNNKTNSSD